MPWKADCPYCEPINGSPDAKEAFYRCETGWMMIVRPMHKDMRINRTAMVGGALFYIKINNCPMCGRELGGTWNLPERKD